MPARPDVLKLKYSTDSDTTIRALIGGGGAAEIEPGELVVGMGNYGVKLYSKDAFGRIVYAVGGPNFVETVDGGDFDAGLPGIAIGEPYLGGFFAGYISYAGNGIADYGLIISPREEGELSQGYNDPAWQWYTGSASTNTDMGDSSVYDGFSNTNNVNDVFHPVAQWARSLTIGDYTDWYIPSRNEWDIISYNLYPISYLYYYDRTYWSPQPAYNTSSVGSQSSAPYLDFTTGDPGMTTSVIFQDAQSQSFTNLFGYNDPRGSIRYWTSTRQIPAAGFPAWQNHATNSGGLGWTVTYSNLSGAGISLRTGARAIRRFAI